MILDRKPTELKIHIDNGYDVVTGVDLSQINLKHLHVLRDKWYEDFDTSVYAHEHYAKELWDCWHYYSRPYLKEVLKSEIFSEIADVASVLDVGCGLGLTTVALQEMFPEAVVYGTNIIGTDQYAFAENIAENIVPDIRAIPNGIDLLVAFEYFEHFEDPIRHMVDIIALHDPQYMLIANSFNTVSIGHYEKYGQYDQSKISRKFNDFLRSRGYKKAKTSLWNNKPAFWKRDA
jgi:SAM-dependent methyltransferase